MDHVARYYFDATEHYARYGGESYGWHYGIWQRGIRTHERALLRSNELLVRGLRLSPESRVLDIGCGSGGFAVWIAANFGCRVTGVTICSLHVDLARRLAEKWEVDRLCRFIEGDMHALDLESDSFDVVTNQETLCCAVDTRQALSEIFRVLVPGGTWRAIDFALGPAPLDPVASAWYEQVLAGFHMTSMTTREEIRAILDSLGFVQSRARDLTRWVGPTASEIASSARGTVRRGELLPNDHLFSTDPIRETNLRGHVQAGLAFSEGLLRGDFRLEYYSAKRPDQAEMIA